MLVLPRLKRVTSWPRAMAYSTIGGPIRPVPPRTRILNCLEAFPVPVSEASALSSQTEAEGPAGENGQLDEVSP